MKNYNGLTLAYIGDAYYEMLVREYLIEIGYTKVNDLHKHAINFTSGESQAKFVDYFLDNNILNDEEVEIYKKGRNQASSYRKNLSLAVYQKATGFESLFGWLYFSKSFDRLMMLFEIIKNIVKSGE